MWAVVMASFCDGYWLLVPGHRAQGVLFDLPHAIDGAKALIADDPVAVRVNFAIGDFFKSVPPGGDVYLLKSILHNWDDERATVILANCRRAMTSEAKLMLIERVMPESMTESLRDQVLVRADLNVLVGHGGRERTAAEISCLLLACGFTVMKFLSVTPHHALIVANPKSG
jgi:hypothetical protein